MSSKGRKKVIFLINYIRIKITGINRQHIITTKTTIHKFNSQLKNLRMVSFILVAMHSLVIHRSGALAVSHLFPLAVTCTVIM